MLPTIQSIMTLGRDANSGDCSPMLGQYSTEEPDSLHAQMYWLTDRYEISELRDDVVSMIKDHLSRLPHALVPTLKHLLGLSISSAGVIPVRSRCALTTKAPQRQASDASGLVDCPDGSPSSPTPSDTAIQPDRTDVLAMVVASGRSGRIDSAGGLSINPEDDADLWSVLVGRSSEYVLQHADDTAFVATMQSKPSFQWAVLQRVAKGHVKMQGEVTTWRNKAVELQAEVGDLQYEVVKLQAGVKHWPKVVSKWRAEVEEWKIETQRCRSEIRELCDALEVDQSRNTAGPTRSRFSKWSRRRHERQEPLANRVSTKRHMGILGSSSRRRLRGSQSRNSSSA
ncbi:hypothetical protein, variant [Exophiala oligosperma]|uniref:Uncharacterized protein n=1 Tax=Exophiala oligosperma TaxID=215243 RepID=A0A0D2DJL7_9EURO|nr:uncharacterized protein PV06_06165 [Exophiala oligosperma]XP_016262851.1 hypothetical protein, variant [Exophiala oligosperma]KIW42634.1 hypothetical protein PV06_06165 [Exophiala oligosperma]KIW42635.1 hypothetical protein, variant [Exophiala oligosperma]